MTVLPLRRSLVSQPRLDEAPGGSRGATGAFTQMKEAVRPRSNMEKAAAPPLPDVARVDGWRSSVGGA
eukprot:11157951-Lingulodinium_polyedra.AAC.1